MGGNEAVTAVGDGARLMLELAVIQSNRYQVSCIDNTTAQSSTHGFFLTMLTSTIAKSSVRRRFSM